MTETIRELRLERDFLLRLLELGHHDDPAALVDEALQTIVSLSGARHGYIELTSPVGLGATRFSASRGALDLDALRELLSSTIMSASRRDGRVIETRVAHLDPRFDGASSVRAHQIDAVICAPIGDPSLGVVYLQGSQEPSGFAPHVAGLVEIFARHMAPLAARLTRQALERGDPTAPWRAKLTHTEAIVGASQALATLFRDTAAAARVDLTLLIKGPSGSGKTSVARIIALNGARKHGPFVHLNCANLPVTLFESEIFGAAKGAHSTASQRTIGKVQAAEKGTLFLDEVAELGLEAQAKLLRLIESKEYSTLGDPQVRRADIRIIAATHADLRERVNDGRFRADLYYRLTSVEVVVPPLEARRVDIAPIARHALAELASAEALRPLSLSEGALRALEAADWPGHIRELKNAVTKAAVRAIADEVSVIEAAHVFPGQAEPPLKSTFQAAMRGHQRQLLSEAFAANDGNVSATAKALGIGRSSLYNLMKALDLRG